MRIRHVITVASLATGIALTVPGMVTAFRPDEAPPQAPAPQQGGWTPPGNAAPAQGNQPSWMPPR